MGKKLTLDEVAEELRIHKRSVRRLISRGELPAVHVGSLSRTLVDADHVAALLHPVVKP